MRGATSTLATTTSSTSASPTTSTTASRSWGPFMIFIIENLYLNYFQPWSWPASTSSSSSLQHQSSGQGGPGAATSLHLTGEHRPASPQHGGRQQQRRHQREQRHGGQQCEAGGGEDRADRESPASLPGPPASSLLQHRHRHGVKLGPSCSSCSGGLEIIHSETSGGQTETLQRTLTE